MKRKLTFIILMAIALVLTACPQTTPASKPIISTFVANPTTLEKGNKTTLSWQVSGADTLTINPENIDVTGKTSLEVSPIATTTYTLTASKGTEQTSKTATVTVQGSTADTTPPTIISVTPTSGAAGVAKDASIVIAFSEKMDQLSTQAAYQSADLPASNVTFNWNNEGTILTVKPNSPLVYASGTNTIIAAKTYAFTISSTAKDTAGNSLASFNSSFSTLKAISTSFLSEATLDGDVTNTGLVFSTSANLLVGDDALNGAIRGFLSFDLTFIFGNAVGIESANLSVYKQIIAGSPYTALEDCTPCFRGASMVLDHVIFGDALTAEDFATLSMGDLGIFDNKAKPTSGFLSTNVTSAVQDDLTNRTTRGNRSQYRLGFLLASNDDGMLDYVSFASGNSGTNQPKLEVVYLIP